MVGMGMNAVSTALLSTLLSAASTWRLAGLFCRRRPASEIQAGLGEIQPKFVQRVKAGAPAAGAEPFPALREQIDPGCQDALRESRAGSRVKPYAGAGNRGAGAPRQRLGGLLRTPLRS